MSFFSLFSLGPITQPPEHPKARPTPKGRRSVPKVPITSPEFRYTSSVETDLRSKWFGRKS